jgi:hypothetical protein
MDTHIHTSRESLFQTTARDILCINERGRDGDVERSTLIFVIILQTEKAKLKRLGAMEQTVGLLRFLSVAFLAPSSSASHSSCYTMMYVVIKDSCSLDIWKSGSVNSLCNKHICDYLNQLLKWIFLFTLRTSFDKCTRQLTVLPTTKNYLKVKNAQINLRRLQKQLHRDWSPTLLSWQQLPYSQ